MTDTAEAKTVNMQTHSALPPEETERLAGEIVSALKTVFDPEIPAAIYELGLIYKVDIKDDRTVDVMMTLPPSALKSCLFSTSALSVPWSMVTSTSESPSKLSVILVPDDMATVPRVALMAP